MSSFLLKARDKESGEIVDVLALDDYFGKRKYGYRIGNGRTLTEEQFYRLYEREEA